MDEPKSNLLRQTLFLGSVAPTVSGLECSSTEDHLPHSADPQLPPVLKAKDLTGWGPTVYTQYKLPKLAATSALGRSLHIRLCPGGLLESLSCRSLAAAPYLYVWACRSLQHG